MIVQPGVSEPSVANMIELIRSNSRRNVDIYFKDTDGTLIDISETETGGTAEGELDLEITDLGGSSVYSETYWPKPIPDSRRIRHIATGKYGLTYGDRDGESDTTGTYLANWHLRQTAASEDIYATQVLEVVSPRTLSILPKLRFMVDKTVKPNLPEEYCFLGYADSQLILGLQLGLCMMNEYQPYPCWRNLDSYDISTHGHVLIKAAMYQLIISQSLFAIDTDIPSYNDQGHSFTLSHFPPLVQVSNTLKQELDRIIPDVKRHYLNNGSLGVEISMNAMAYLTFQSAPYGSILKNFWARV